MDSDNAPDDDRRPRLVTPPPSFAAEGDLLDGRYRLDALIGRGGTAEVYRSTDVLLGRSVAVKVFDIRLTDLNSVERQRSEMRSLAALDDPHLVAVHDARLVDVPDGPAGRFAPDHSYLVMELVSGRTLAERLHDGPITLHEAAAIGIAVATGLAAAHDRGLVHRDVKPANVLLADSGAVKLGDFGLARMLTAETRFTSGAALIGTAAYFSPEQARNEHVAAPADVYALGLVLLEALTGRREFPGSPVSSAVARLLRDPQIPQGLPAPWATLLTRMTDQDPEVRPTAVEVARILADVDDGAPVVVPVAATPRPVPVPLLLSDEHSPGDHAMGEHLAKEPSADPETSAWSSPLSPFLQRETVAAGRRRRRSGLLVGAVALVGAVGLTLAISTSGEPPAVAAPTTGAAAGSSSARSTLEATSRPTPTTASTTPRAVTSPSRATAASSRRTTSTGRTEAAATASVPVRATTQAVAARPSTAAPSVSAAAVTPAAAERVAVQKSAASQAAARQAAARQAAVQRAAEKTAAQRVAEKAAAQRVAEKAAAQRVIEKAAAQRAADRTVAARKQAATEAAQKKKASAEKSAKAAKKAAEKAAEKATEKAAKGAEKKDAAQKNDSHRGAKDAPGRPGKKP